MKYEYIKQTNSTNNCCLAHSFKLFCGWMHFNLYFKLIECVSKILIDIIEMYKSGYDTINTLYTETN